MQTRNVSVIILHDQGKVLLQKRSKTAKRFPGKWGLFGGGIEENEDPESGLKREILEELGTKIDSLIKFKTYPYVLDCRHEKGNIHAFICKYNGCKLNLMEGEEMRWVSLNEALKLDLYPDYRKILEDIGQSTYSMVL